MCSFKCSNCDIQRWISLRYFNRNHILIVWCIKIGNMKITIVYGKSILLNVVFSVYWRNSIIFGRNGVWMCEMAKRNSKIDFQVTVTFIYDYFNKSMVCLLSWFYFIRYVIIVIMFITEKRKIIIMQISFDMIHFWISF